MKQQFFIIQEDTNINGTQLCFIEKLLRLQKLDIW